MPRLACATGSSPWAWRAAGRQDIEAAKLAMLDAQGRPRTEEEGLRALPGALSKRTKFPARRATRPPPTSRARRLLMIARSKSTTNSLEGTRKEELAVDRANVHQAHQNLEHVSHPSDVHRAARAFQRSGAGAAGGVGRGRLTRHAHRDPWPTWTICGCACMCRRRTSARCTGARPLMCAPILIRARFIAGRISFISSEAEFTPKSVQTEKERVTLVYRVKVDVENPNTS